ncbi:MAG: hypothetical protein ACI8P3_001627 [Saprospiraceae bacterium]
MSCKVELGIYFKKLNIMSFTRITQLTTDDPTSGEISIGPVSIVPLHTFFYWEDIAVVLAQDPDAKISSLQLQQVKFERNDGANHNQFEVPVLALRKTEGEIHDLNGDINNTEEGKSHWHSAVAISWPPYYRRGTTDLLDNTNPGFINDRFEGDDDYRAGFPLNKV